MVSKFFNIESNGIRVVNNKLIIDCQYLGDFLDSNKQYELRIPNGVIKDYIGNNVESPIVKLTTGESSPIGFDIIDNIPYDNAINVSVNPEIVFEFNKEWHIINVGVYFSEMTQDGFDHSPTRRDNLTIWSQWSDVTPENRGFNNDIEIWKHMVRYFPVPHLNLNDFGLPSNTGIYTSKSNPDHKIADRLEYNTTYYGLFVFVLSAIGDDPTRPTTMSIPIRLVFTTAPEGVYSYSGGTGIPGTESCSTRTGLTGGTGLSGTGAEVGKEGYPGMPGLWNFCHEKGGLGGTGATGSPGPDYVWPNL